MKKFFSIFLILIFAVSTMSYASVSNVSKQQKIISKTGTVNINKTSIELKGSNYMVVLIGQTKGITQLKNKVIKVNGYMSNNKFYVKGYSLLKTQRIKDIKPIVTPTPVKKPLTDNSGLTTIIGFITANNIEGLHYELTAEQGVYVLVGYDKNELAKYVGKSVKVVGKIQENQISFYQSGVLFSVKTIEEVKESTTQSVDIGKFTVKSFRLIGTVIIDKVKGPHIGLLVDENIYELSGSVEGIEKLNGKRIQVTGYIPDIRYIRAPDYTMFEVTSYGELE